MAESDLSTQKNEFVRCAACGATFECGAAVGKSPCWCAELPALPKERVTDEGCFCRECLLKKLAAK